jgi:hypothetical protein
MESVDWRWFQDPISIALHSIFSSEKDKAPAEEAGRTFQRNLKLRPNIQGVMPMCIWTPRTQCSVLARLSFVAFAPADEAAECFNFLQLPSMSCVRLFPYVVFKHLVERIFRRTLCPRPESPVGVR